MEILADAAFTCIVLALWIVCGLLFSIVCDKIEKRMAARANRKEAVRRAVENHMILYGHIRSR